MIDELRRAFRYILGADIAGRLIRVYPDDTFIVSYPRSGNTWMRFLIANLVHSEPVTFRNIEQVIPDIYMHSRRYLNRIPRPRILKSHESLDLRYKRLIYIVRDPRDVALSSYYFHLKQKQIEESVTIEQYVDEFIKGLIWSSYGSWGQNVRSWLNTRQSGIYISPLGPGASGIFGSWSENVASWMAAGPDGRKFLLMRYEDMLASPAGELARVAEFLNVDCSTEILERAIGRSSARQMRELEQKESLEWQLTRATRQDLPFVREARVGSWKTGLPSSCVAAIESAWKPVMMMLGYELSAEGSAGVTPTPVPWEAVKGSATR